MEQAESEAPTEELSANGDSLSARMQARANEIDDQRTERFDLPGYNGLLEVELRPLGFRAVRANVDRNKRVRDPGLRELYGIADNLAEATVAFHEIRDDNSRRSLTDSWQTLAQRLPDCPDGPTARQAILFLLGENRIMFLAEEWSTWQSETRTEVDREVTADFGRTG